MPDEVTQLLEQATALARANPLAFWHVQAPIGTDGRRLWPCALPTQLSFHKSQARDRWGGGGNQAGKTEVCCRELGYWLGHCHPFRDTPKRALRVRYYALDFVKVEEIILPKLRRILPPDIIDRRRGRDGYNSDKHILYVKTPHTVPGGAATHEVHFSTYDQELSKAEGGEFDAIIWDEPPPQQLYQANMLRVLARGGCQWGAMTPLGMEIPWDISWIYEDITCRADGKEIAWFELRTEENRSNLDAGVLDRILRDMPAWQRETRLEGKFAFLKGLVYPEFSQETHTCPPFDVRARVEAGLGRVWAGLDHGLHNPTAVVFAYVEGEGEDARAYQLAEYVSEGRTIAENCAGILDTIGGLPVECWPADPSTWKHDPITNTTLAEEYHRCGVPIVPGDNDIPKGHAVVGRWLAVPRGTDGKHWKQDPSVARPRYLIFDNGRNTETIRSLRAYVWLGSRSKLDTGKREKPAEGRKHLPDAIRYLLTFGPSGIGAALQPLPPLDRITGMPHWGQPDPVEAWRLHKNPELGVIGAEPEEVLA